MALQFVFGRSGVGKTKYLRDEIIKKAIDNPDTNYVIMVPEQYNLQTQMEYVLSHPREGILNIDVLSFKRLAYKIFGEVGGFNNLVLDESGKLMILKKLVKANKDKLSILQKNIDRMESLDKIKSIISEFSQYHVSIDTFSKIIEDDVFPGLSGKLIDLVTIYEDYLNYISSDFITDEQVMDVLAEKIPKSEYIKNTIFVFDEYTGFTFLQNQVLRQLICNAKKVIISLTMDIGLLNETVVSESNLFLLSVNTKTELSNMAYEEHVKVLKPVCLEKKANDMPKEFSFLEQHLFEYTMPVFEETTDRLVICESASIKDEILYIRAIISKLVREENYSYRDIAVVCGDLNKYGVFFQKLFSDAGIPSFVDDSKPMLNNSFIASIKALISIVIEDFSYNSVFSFFRNNMLSIDVNDIDLLENYCIALGIKGERYWEAPWNRRIKNQSEEELAKLNSLREAFISAISEFVYVMKSNKSDIREMIFALYTFLVEQKCEARLKKMSEDFEKNGDYIRFIEYRQVYAAVIYLFEELVELMGNEKVSADEFMDILNAGFSAVKLGILPPENDYVVLADVERSRLGRTKVLFLLGANEGIIPKNKEKSGFLNEAERLYLKASKINLSPTSHEEYFTQKYYLYRMLTKASEKLYISYCTGGSDEDKMLPSYLVKSISDMFPNCSFVKTEKIIRDKSFIQNKSDAYAYLLNNYALQDDNWENIYAYLLKDEGYKDNLTSFQQGLIYKGNETKLGEKLAEKLFMKDDVLYTSVSKLECYSACPFAYFLKYGLKLQERLTSDISYIDYGNVFHQALSDFVLAVKNSGMDIRNIDDDMMKMLSEKCINNAYKKLRNSYGEALAREEYHVKRMIRLMRRTVWAMKKQFSDSSYNITAVERTFNESDFASHIKLDSGEMVLRGRIDRIDSYRDNDNEYVRIIDYKTGSTSFSLMKFYYGIQLQLIVYMDIATDMIKTDFNAEESSANVLPVGAFYYHIDDPIIKKDDKKSLDVEAAILKQLDLDGYSLEKFKKLEEIFTTETLLNYSRKIIKKLGNKILQGNFDLRPYQMEGSVQNRACDLCDYKQECLFDDSLPWCKSRVLKHINETKAVSLIAESEASDNELD